MQRKSGNYQILSGFQYYTPGISGMFALLLWLLVGSLLGSFVTVLVASVAGLGASAEYSMLISYPLMFVPPLIYASYKSHRNAIFDTGFALDNNHFGNSGGWVAALVAAVATLACAFVCDGLNTLLPPMPLWLETMFKQMTGGTLWVNLLCVSVMAPLCEEWLCRGMILRGLLNHKREDGSTMHPAWAIVISALFFGLIHANPWQALPAFMLGCLFGYVYYKTGSLKLTMLMHCVNNTFAVIMSRIPAFEDANDWLDILEPRMYWLIAAACVLLLVLSIRFFGKVPLTKKSGNCDET